LSAAAEEGAEAGQSAGDEVDEGELAEITRVIEVGDVDADAAEATGPEPAATGAPAGRDDPAPMPEP
jgi:hypothetical protein